MLEDKKAKRRLRDKLKGQRPKLGDYKKVGDAEDATATLAGHISDCAQAYGREPCDLTWVEFREYAHYSWGQSSIGLVRKDVTKHGGFNAIRDAYFPRKATDQAVTVRRLREHAALNRKLGQEAEHAAFVLAEIDRLANKVFRGRVRAVKVPKARKVADRVVTLVLSDLHFGSDLLAEETGVLDYGRIQEARRLAQVIKQAIEYKVEYRARTRLRLILAGDIIRGEIHDKRDGAVISEQVCRSIHLLIQAILILSQHFASIDVECVDGNHGRRVERHPGRATVGKWDSWETIIYSSVRMALEHVKHVKFNIPKTPYLTYEDFGQKTFVTHGDTVLSAGNPGKSVNTGGIENQINRINAALEGKGEYSTFIMGHTHVPLITPMTNGAMLVLNGCLIPTDNFCVSIGLLKTVCYQVIYESVAGHPVGDQRFIKLDSTVDNNAELDKLIKPWAQF